MLWRSAPPGISEDVHAVVRSLQAYASAGSKREALRASSELHLLHTTRSQLSELGEDHPKTQQSLRNFNNLTE